MQDNRGNRQTPGAPESEDEKAVRSIPLDTDDGRQVVIEQQNMGGARQVGGGEFKNVDGKRSPAEAAADQAKLEREAPIGQGAEGDATGLDPDAPGVSVLGLQPDQPVEPNEPA